MARNVDIEDLLGWTYRVQLADVILGHGVDLWDIEREFVLARDKMCQADGCDQPAKDVDHIVPRSRGGEDRMSNLQGLCHAHHSQKTPREDGRWRPR